MTRTLGAVELFVVIVRPFLREIHGMCSMAMVTKLFHKKANTDTARLAMTKSRDITKLALLLGARDFGGL